jgi:hypothetical protein
MSVLIYLVCLLIFGGLGLGFARGAESNGEAKAMLVVCLISALCFGTLYRWMLAR